MRVLLFVEGEMEQKGLPPCLSTYYQRSLGLRLRFQPICFRGSANYVGELAKKVRMHLEAKASGDILAAFGIVDLYGLPLHLPGWQNKGIADKVSLARKHFETQVGHPKFRQFFAVHETEAWLLADSARLPDPVRKALPGRCTRPEEVNHDMPPAKLLDKLYRDKASRGYQKSIDGVNMLRDLSPDTVSGKCPYFREMLTELTTLVTAGVPA